MKNIYIPCTDASDWKPLLAQPERHWRSGYSAKTLAHSWSDADGFPVEVRDALRTSDNFRDIELLLAIPEHKVSLPGGQTASQNDIWVLASAGGDLVSIAVEGKVSESFDKPVNEWMRPATSGKRARLQFLCAELEIQEYRVGNIPYQLLHRCASSLIEARRYSATHAVILVHSFSSALEHFDDFRSFVALYDCVAIPNRVASTVMKDGTSMHFVWVVGDPGYLKK